MNVEDPPQIEEPVHGPEPDNNPQSPEAPTRPDVQPSDPHVTPLDDIEDAKWLSEEDPRRKAVEEHKKGGMDASD